MDRKLPYAGNVRVERKLPATLQITVEEPVLSAAFEQDDSYILVSQENKILEIAQAAPAGCLVGVRLGAGKSPGRLSRCSQGGRGAAGLQQPDPGPVGLRLFRHHPD